MMSMRVAPSSWQMMAASAMISGFEPKICTPTGCSSFRVDTIERVFLFLKTRPLDEIISVKTSSAPHILAVRLKGKSVIPARGARRTFFLRTSLPLMTRVGFCMDEIPGSCRPFLMHVRGV